MTSTIPAALLDAATRFPDHEAVVDGPVRLTYARLHERVRECARMFLAEGVAAGDRVALCVPNTHHWVIAALGAHYAGATIVPINTRYTGPEMLDILARTRATAFVVVGEFLGADRLAQVRAAAAALPADDGPVPGLPALRTVVRVPLTESDAAAGVLNWADIPARAAGVDEATLDARRDAIDPNSPSDILFTSGTTGRSKGAMSSHAQALGVARAWAEVTGLTERDRYLVINPFFHSFGYKAGILAAISRGTALLPQLTFDVADALELIQRERISVLPGVPTIYQAILDHPARGDYDLSSLRIAVTGAAIVPVVLVERLRAELDFDVITAYGLTEAVVATMCRPDDDPETIAHTSGRAAADFEIRIAGPDGEPLEPGRTGEILLRGPNVMLGYLDDPQATAEAVDADGWLHTGDVGELDERGYLRITDRLKDMYVSGGFNVYPAEVEQALARLDGVAEAAVVGVPDARLGEVGKAFLVVKPGAELTADAVLAHCKSMLANYKAPRSVEFVAELPRNAGGKVLKRVLRERSQKEAQEKHEQRR